MKKQLFFIAFICCIVVFNTSCKMNVLRGEGNKTTTNPAVNSFNSVSVDIEVNTVINIREGATPSVQIQGYENLLKHIVAEVNNNRLRITHDLDDTWRMESEGVTVTITMPAITNLTLMGAADAEVHGNITGRSFYLDVSGASDVSIDNITVDSFLVDASGATDLEVKGGTVKFAEYDISGAGEVKAYPLQTEETIASISGAGTSHITALQKLTADISGAGAIKYKGHPTITKDISGAGTISDAN
jgi:hypothetical protein